MEVIGRALGQTFVKPVPTELPEPEPEVEGLIFPGTSASRKKRKKNSGLPGLDHQQYIFASWIETPCFSDRQPFNHEMTGTPNRQGMPISGRSTVGT